VKVRTLAVGALCAASLAVAPASQAASAANPTLDVIFNINGTIAVTLPDGTPVGTTSGAPTVITAGYYSVLVSGPGGCAQLPLFDLKGPGEALNDDMSGGEVNTEVYNIFLQPNATYTWRIDNVNPPIVHTFTTSSTIAGTPLGSSATGGSGVATQPSSQDIVGSAIVPVRGKLAASVSPAGKLALSFQGKSVGGLTAGRYTFTVVDESPRSGFMLEKSGHAPMKVTGPAFVGKRTLTVNLTAGRWLVLPAAGGRQAASIAVSAGK
jgi:hypothetical protein